MNKPTASTLHVTDPGLIQSITRQMRAPKHAAKKKRANKRTTFRVKWARIPAAWRSRLRQTQSAHAVNLAITILFEAYRAERCGNEIVLSTHTTGLQGTNRIRAIKELEKLGLIRVQRKGQQASRIELRHY
jgi:hypothetical protein